MELFFLIDPPNEWSEVFTFFTALQYDVERQVIDSEIEENSCTLIDKVRKKMPG